MKIRKCYFICAITLFIACTSSTKVNTNLDTIPPNDFKDTTTVKLVPYTKEGLLKLFREIEKNEPSAKSYVFDENSGYLYIAVVDDGTSRKGLAEYYCQLCKDFDVSVNGVHITEYKYRKPKPEFDPMLGVSYCRF